MGNCLKSHTSDDISLLHDSQSDRASFGDGVDPDLEPPPPYQVKQLRKARDDFQKRSLCAKDSSDLPFFVVLKRIFPVST